MRSADPAFRIVLGLDCEPRRGITIAQARDLMAGLRAFRLGRERLGLRYGAAVPMRTGATLEREQLVFAVKIGRHRNAEVHWLLTARGLMLCDVLEQWLRGPGAADAFLRMQVAEVLAA